MSAIIRVMAAVSTASKFNFFAYLNRLALQCEACVAPTALIAANMEKSIWPEPGLVAVIEYAKCTPANHLRHADFVGLREDKNPREVTRERPI